MKLLSRLMDFLAIVAFSVFCRDGSDIEFGVNESAM